MTALDMQKFFSFLLLSSVLIIILGMGIMFLVQSIRSDKIYQMKKRYARIAKRKRKKII